MPEWPPRPPRPTVHAHWSKPFIRRFPGRSAQSACFDVTYKTRIPPFLLLPFYFVALVVFPFLLLSNPPTTAATENPRPLFILRLLPAPPASLVFAAFPSRRPPSGSPSQMLHSVYTALRSLLPVISFWRNSSAWITRYTSQSESESNLLPLHAPAQVQQMADHLAHVPLASSEWPTHTPALGAADPVRPRRVQRLSPPSPSIRVMEVGHKVHGL
ncbi:hypothetical protein P152DRAFT_481446 [Eremomyces bilateralis CBS 781.70]|uniref:Uncharacterized protein n=1 Tax=Eremomyces bilateralis CBS 781.70 TaxID=1392243 RepID=A0A6G1G5H6_9PEZI|nr:uncharacterized protein P152DRAFT_481446 [Eremomyces bilateralis CBS 781.70]KAF1813345.1 hypothetical protein P152DRAFT_481446 [Eremomyces bilateralis CBS 781.70]